MPNLLFDTEEEFNSFVLNLPVISDDGGIQSFYVKMRLEGTVHMLAEMFAFRQPPGSSNTDRAFQEGQISRYQGNELWLTRARQNYKKATGKDLPQGMIYISQIAKGPCDPRAWVSDLGDVKKRAEQLGHGVDSLGVKENLSEVKRVRIAPDIVNQHLRKAVANPENIGKNVHELREQIVEKHAYDSSKLE